jgi:hypothetical protein
VHGGLHQASKGKHFSHRIGATDNGSLPLKLNLKGGALRPKCRQCENPAARRGTYKSGKTKYGILCSSCHKKKYHQPHSLRPYQKYKGEQCEFCGFIPIHTCQLDVDHKNGDKRDNRPENLQTLCANCHRLKTLLNKDNHTPRY